MGFGRYLSQIPNGNSVMDPCTGRPWSGLGHIDPAGGGPRNAFGIAFATNGRAWNQGLCMADSDNDGLTNGQELGDPTCSWRPGTQPQGGATSHPEAERLQFLREQDRLQQQLQQNLIENPLRIRQEGQRPRFNIAPTDNQNRGNQNVPSAIGQNLPTAQAPGSTSAQSELERRLIEQQRILALQQQEILRLQQQQLRQQSQQQQPQGLQQQQQQPQGLQQQSQPPQQQISRNQENLMRQFQQNLQTQFNQPPPTSNQLVQPGQGPQGANIQVPATPPAMPRLPPGSQGRINSTGQNLNLPPPGQGSTNNMPPPPLPLATQPQGQPASFQCTGISNPDTGSWTLKIPKARVPNEQDSYICSEYDFTVPGDFHMIAIQPIIDNPDVISAVKLFACDEDFTQNQITYPYYCNPLPKAKCRNLLSISTKTDSGTCYPSNAGIKIGRNGYKRFIVQLHWVNPNRRQGLTDSSGLKLYYTNQMRQYDIGSKLVQYVGFNIPQSTPGHTVSATCPSECTSQQVKQPSVNVFQTIHQMNNYNPPKQILPGDDLRLSCVYDTQGANSSVRSGSENNDELCSAFLLYYPKLNWDSYSCEKYKAVDMCKLDVAGATVNGCDYTGLLNTLQYDSFSADMLANCTRVCSCTPGCNTISNYAKNHPCFTGDFIEIHNYRLARNMGSSDRLQNLLKSMDLAKDDIIVWSKSFILQTVFFFQIAVLSWFKFIMTN
ncbi:hypothetical protein KUTeg_000654, partial [Tegillarca granosa]